MSKEKPISFSTPMVKAIFEDRKTKTRRVIKGMGNKMHYGRLLGDWGLSDPPELIDGVLHWKLQTDVDDDRMFDAKCPWKVGQILWVKETWLMGDDGYHYKADATTASEEMRVAYGYKWKSSRFMPRSVARLFLKVVSIRVERLQGITEEDARAEGCIDFHDKIGDEKFDDVAEFDLTARDAFTELWDGINTKRGYGWDVNPWVYVIEFQRVESES